MRVSKQLFLFVFPESAHVDEIQRLAFEAMVLKGSVHKYVHSVVGICFASTATNGVPVPPFLIFPMVPGQKSLKELLLHTRRVAGIRDSAADAGNGSVGRAAGKVCLSTTSVSLWSILVVISSVKYTLLAMRSIFIYLFALPVLLVHVVSLRKYAAFQYLTRQWAIEDMSC